MFQEKELGLKFNFNSHITDMLLKKMDKKQAKANKSNTSQYWFFFKVEVLLCCPGRSAAPGLCLLLLLPQPPGVAGTTGACRYDWQGNFVSGGQGRHHENVTLSWMMKKSYEMWKNKLSYRKPIRSKYPTARKSIRELQNMKGASMYEWRRDEKLEADRKEPYCRGPDQSILRPRRNHWEISAMRVHGSDKDNLANTLVNTDQNLFS